MAVWQSKQTNIVWEGEKSPQKNNNPTNHLPLAFSKWGQKQDGTSIIESMEQGHRVFPRPQYQQTHSKKPRWIMIIAWTFAEYKISARERERSWKSESKVYIRTRLTSHHRHPHSRSIKLKSPTRSNITMCIDRVNVQYQSRSGWPAIEMKKADRDRADDPL